jgi:hypothetical protein
MMKLSNSKIRFSLAAAGCVSLLAVFAYLFAPRFVVMNNATATPHAMTAAQGTSEKTANSDVGGGSTTAGVEPRSARIEQELRNTRDMAAFIQSALSRPAEGGRYFVKVAWGLCQQYTTIPAEKLRTTIRSNVQPERIQAAQQLLDWQARCASVPTQFDQSALFRSLHDERGDTDPLLALDKKIGRIWPDDLDVKQIRANWNTIVSAGEGPIIAHAMAANGESLLKLVAPKLNIKAHSEAIAVASGIAACQVRGSDCDLLPIALHACAIDGQCFPDSASAIRAHVSSEQERKVVDQLVPKFVALLQQR